MTYETLMERLSQRQTTVPDVPRQTVAESWHYRFLSKYDEVGLLGSQIERRPPQAHLPLSRLLGLLEQGYIPFSSLQNHSQDKLRCTLLSNIPNWPLFVPHTNNSSADQQMEAVLQAAIPLILFPLRGPAIFRAVG